jgi:hypothetical protein
MADYIVKDTELTSVANAIRTAGGTNSLLSFPNGFVSAVGNISGGGSSDFSTATLTVVGGSISATIPFIQTLGDSQYIRGDNYTFETGTYDIVLYKNTAILMTEKPVTGNAEPSGQEGIWLVSGDITIQGNTR